MFGLILVKTVTWEALKFDLRTAQSVIDRQRAEIIKLRGELSKAEVELRKAKEKP